MRALWESWKANGKEALEKVRADKPDLYVKLVTAMLPKAPDMKPEEADDLDDAALDRRIASLASALGLAIGARKGARGKGGAGDAEPAGEL